MSKAIRPLDPQNRPFFAGEVSGIDLTHRCWRDGIVRAESSE